MLGTGLTLTWREPHGMENCSSGFSFRFVCDCVEPWLFLSEKLILLLVRTFNKVIQWALKKVTFFSPILISSPFSLCYLNVVGFNVQDHSRESRGHRRREGISHNSWENSKLVSSFKKENSSKLLRAEKPETSHPGLTTKTPWLIPIQIWLAFSSQRNGPDLKQGQGGLVTNWAFLLSPLGMRLTTDLPRG